MRVLGDGLRLVQLAGFVANGAVCVELGVDVWETVGLETVLDSGGFVIQAKLWPGQLSQVWPIEKTDIWFWETHPRVIAFLARLCLIIT